ncbi:MAG: iron-sulfur cluster insertion protein ErpA [Anaerolineaceae bacterium]
MLEANSESTSITLTPAAIQAIKDLKQTKNIPEHALRIFISGGGCSGYQYGMAFESRIRPEDFSYEFDGIKVVVDEVSINYLNGSTVDYIDDPNGAGFKIENPNAISNCNCGSSYNSQDNCCGC